MTTKANKFGLRKAAEERTNRHAQRTPLPPKAGKVADARMVLDFAEGVVEKSAKSAVAASDPKSLGKAEGFAAKAVAAKWEAVVASRGDAIEVTATRGPETIVQSWRGGVWMWEASVYAFADRTTKPRNASGALKLLDRPATEAAKETAKVASNNSFRRRTPTDLAPIALPLDPELLTDQEAAKFFRGQTVRWYNRMSRNAETAMVSRHSVVRVTRWEGETTVSFCCPVTGFRAFHLSAVLAVGRGKASGTDGEHGARIELVEAA
jgi:hypothetical protein